MSDPIPLQVTRWRCPFCFRTHSTRTRALGHIARCWYNPDNQSCKTCTHYEPNSSEPEVGYLSPEWCRSGVDLATTEVDRRGFPTLPIHCPKWEPKR